MESEGVRKAFYSQLKSCYGEVRKEVSSTRRSNHEKVLCKQRHMMLRFRTRRGVQVV